MKGTVLIAGGAGFVGSHLADELLSADYRVRVLDSLIAQVHGQRYFVGVYVARACRLVLETDAADGRVLKIGSGLPTVVEVALEDGLRELSEWLRTQRPADRAEDARRELEERGLSV